MQPHCLMNCWEVTLGSSICSVTPISPGQRPACCVRVLLNKQQNMTVVKTFADILKQDVFPLRHQLKNFHLCDCHSVATTFIKLIPMWSLYLCQGRCDRSGFLELASGVSLGVKNVLVEKNVSLIHQREQIYLLVTLCKIFASKCGINC